jgi:hypothetical protein
MSEKWDYQPPVTHQPITVNVDDWLGARQADRGLLQQPRVDVSVEQLQEEAEQRQEQWFAAQQERLREHQLEVNAVECSNCDQLERPYKNDYLCYNCRDALDKETK